MTKILVCGGRDFKDYSAVSEVLYDYKDEVTLLIQGGALGADYCAKRWADVNEIPMKEFPAQWDKYGKKAGFLRNKQMLDEGQPDLVIAFPGGKGTKMMVNLARKAGVEVIDFNDEED